MVSEMESYWQEYNLFVLTLLEFVHSDTQCLFKHWVPFPPGVGHGDGDYLCPFVCKPVLGGWEECLFICDEAP